MNIEQLRKERATLENDLRAMIAERVGYFKELTGCSPDYIRIDMGDITKIGDAQREYMVGGVQVRIEM